MRPEEWSNVKALVSELQGQDPAQWQRRVEQAYPTDASMRHEVIELLDRLNRSTEWMTTETWPSPPNPDAPPELAPGDTCGVYRLLRQIGSGGMGLVFLAEDTQLRTQVALKTLRVLSQPDIHPSEARTRMMDEATRQAALRGHPHIATLLHVFDYGAERRWPMLVMEYVEGTSASALLANGPARPERVLRWASQVSSAIEHAHNRGILHCDLKPGNIQITGNDNAKVLDFGLARAVHVSGGGPGVFGGTLPYMAPEQLSERQFSEQSDIYSLGVTLFELLTGRRPFEAVTRPELVVDILGCPPPRASSYAPGLPREVDEVLARAMTKDPRQRFRTARELMEALNRAFGVAPQPAPVPPAGVSQWIGGIAAAVIISTIMGFITSRAMDLGVGRTGAFNLESPLWWPVWGLMMFTAPVVIFGTYLVGLYVLWGVSRAIYRLPPIGKLAKPIVDSVAGHIGAFRSVPTSTLAQILLALQVGVLALLGWYFYPLLNALIVFVDPSVAGSLRELSPGHASLHSQYRLFSSLDLFGFSAAWYGLFRRSRRESSPVHSSTIVAGVALTIVTLFAYSLPFRPLRHNEYERVLYDSETCYLTARTDQELLLFCPLRLPRTQTVTGSAPLDRTGVPESIFQPFDHAK